MTGLPQLDLVTYLPQAVWTAGSLLVLLSGMTVIGSKISKNIEARTSNLRRRTDQANSDLSEATKKVEELEATFSKTKKKLADDFTVTRIKLNKEADLAIAAADRTTAENIQKFKQELLEEEAKLDLSSEVDGIKDVLDKTLFKPVNLEDVKWN